jgi:hypothetical protein
VSGRVLLGPTCPVQRAGQSCERGYQATIAVFTKPRHRLIKKFRSGTDGRFSVRLAPGRYTLSGTNRGLPRATPVKVTVRPHRFTSVIITFDTGIR